MKRYINRNFFIIFATIIAVWLGLRLFSPAWSNSYSYLIGSIAGFLVLRAIWIFVLRVFPKSIDSQQAFDENHKGANPYVGSRWVYELGMVFRSFGRKEQRSDDQFANNQTVIVRRNRRWFVAPYLVCAAILMFAISYTINVGNNFLVDLIIFGSFAAMAFLLSQS